MFWVISVLFNIRNILPKSGTFLLGHPVYTYAMGRAVAKWLRHYATHRQVAGSIPDGVIGIFQVALWSWSRSTQPLNRNENQEYFLGGKARRCVKLTTLPPSCAVVMKSGNLNFLEPSGPLQACNGTALPIYAL